MFAVSLHIAVINYMHGVAVWNWVEKKRKKLEQMKKKEGISVKIFFVISRVEIIDYFHGLLKKITPLKISILCQKLILTHLKI